jgi:hypothetical protein
MTDEGKAFGVGERVRRRRAPRRGTGQGSLADTQVGPIHVSARCRTRFDGAMSPEPSRPTVLETVHYEPDQRAVLAVLPGGLWLPPGDIVELDDPPGRPGSSPLGYTCCATT